jgi:hypothetical protein
VKKQKSKSLKSNLIRILGIALSSLLFTLIICHSLCAEPTPPSLPVQLRARLNYLNHRASTSSSSYFQGEGLWASADALYTWNTSWSIGLNISYLGLSEREVFTPHLDDLQVMMTPTMTVLLSLMRPAEIFHDLGW